MSELYQHQREALEAILSSYEDGRIVIPTGGGKTRIESNTLRESLNNTDPSQIYLVLAPRIGLANQLMREYRSDIGQQSYRAVAFHSGRAEQDYNLVNKWSETSTTNPFIIKDEHKKAKKNGMHLVVFSTYHSSCKLLENFKFELVIADESQYCVAENFHNCVLGLNAHRKLYFTATEKHTPTDEGRGLNNTDKFGDVLYQESPQVLIDRGIIVAPRLHVMSGTKGNDDDTTVDEIKHIARYQMSLSSHMPTIKILFACANTSDVVKVIESMKEFKKEFPEYKVFTIVSNGEYGSMIDGVKVDREQWMEELRNSKHALIFHYDILSEGIDVDGITGVAIMRNMHHAKLLQTIGRGCRVLKEDRGRAMEDRLKKYNYISVCSINGDDETSDNVSRTLEAIIEGGFDVNVEEVEFTNNEDGGIAPPNALDDVEKIDRNAHAKKHLQNVKHEIEKGKELLALKELPFEELMKKVA